MLNVVNGNLLDMADQGKFNVIVQGCNCFCAMGSGIAKQIADRYPTAQQADYKTEKGDRSKLGTYTSATVGDLTIVNAYTQFHWITEDESSITKDKPRGVVADYNAIESVFKKIRADFPGANIGIPLIGAGLAGGDWVIINTIIDNIMVDEKVTLVLYEG